MWRDGRLSLDREEDILTCEEWWTPSAGDDDVRCWWPGPAPAEACARLARVRYRQGYALSSPVELLSPTAFGVDLGDRWPDARAGIACWTCGGTQLHNNEVRVAPSDDPTCLRILNDTADGGLTIVLRHFSDPRFNNTRFAGVRLRIRGTISALRTVDVVLQWQTAGRYSGRREISRSVQVAEDGTLEISRVTLGLSRRVTWSQVVQAHIYIGGMRGTSCVIEQIVRIPSG